MYFTRLPDHAAPGFDEALHFSQFKKHNIIFNAVSGNSFCDDHVGCLSLKTVLSGEECYGIEGRQLTVKPGQVLILNNDQPYSCRISSLEKVHCVSVFFKKEFAAAVMFDALNPEERLLEHPFPGKDVIPEFFQALNAMTPELQDRLSALLGTLERVGYDAAMTDEHLIYLLHYLLRLHQRETRELQLVSALKSSTKKEIYRRLCIARDLLHASFTEALDLDSIGRQACLSVPQLVRQFRSAFHCTLINT
ncbi:hypothetical protein LL912_04690 [Niabella sp. CC-SYL272]|uniref:hypothetical protein n=1 Tax=Niabella agricola TaxID=2891571 RepID=UPI001F403BD6|nr:hypothetical protein [Niabella agricola]MCF3108069.1 hypothetical protein [Niabella agricola]